MLLFYLTHIICSVHKFTMICTLRNIVGNFYKISIIFFWGGRLGSNGRALASRGVLSPFLAGSIPNRYPCTYCVYPIVNMIRNFSNQLIKGFSKIMGLIFSYGLCQVGFPYKLKARNFSCFYCNGMSGN